MNSKSLLLIFCVFGVAITGVAQTRSLTNADLEKYRNQRLQAEEQYRQDYSKLGLPSPEELKLRIEREQNEIEKLSFELRESRQERERIEIERQLLNRRVFEYNRERQVEIQMQSWWPMNYFYSAIGPNWNPRFNPRQVQSGYFAGGHFWPTPVRVPTPKPVWLPRK